ncbi:MAG: sugar ABC transporter substrate-binding protein [Nitrospinaceae bacterium]|nr:MAG: sugar ABC transporter substrate-binding protein [Nitrospinaceae bacterium]
MKCIKMKVIIFICLTACFLLSHSAGAQVFGSSASDSARKGGKLEKDFSPSTPIINQSNPFVLGPEDLISISVWGNKELTTEMPVRPDGTISYPLIGDVKAQGLTPAQLKDTIAKEIRNYITDASVTVIVQEINSINISVAGEVVEPGTYKVNRPITLMHLFSMVKGFTEKADLRKSYLLRNGRKVKINIYSLVKEDDFTQNIWLKPNDLVFIHDNFGNRINIMGEVEKPQVVTYQEGMTVMDAILLAEGLTDIAKANGTKVYRKNLSQVRTGGGIQKISVPLDKVIFEGDLSKNLELKPGDIIHVPRSFF